MILRPGLGVDGAGSPPGPPARDLSAGIATATAAETARQPPGNGTRHRFAPQRPIARGGVPARSAPDQALTHSDPSRTPEHDRARLATAVHSRMVCAATRMTGTPGRRPIAEMSTSTARISIHEVEYSLTLSRPCRRSPHGLSDFSGRKSDRRFFVPPHGEPECDSRMQIRLICMAASPGGAETLTRQLGSVLCYLRVMRCLGDARFSGPGRARGSC